MWTYTISSPRTITPLEAPDPGAVEVGEVLVKPLAGGVCGSDMPFYRGRFSPVQEAVNSTGAALPGFSLHEIAGEVVSCPGGEFAPGDLVVGWAEGSNALAEWVVTPAASVVAYDRAIAPEFAVVMQPLACVLYTMTRLPQVAGKHVAVIGLGPIGLLFTHAAAAAGAARVTGVDPIDRSAVSRTFGIDDLVTLTSDRWARSLADEDRPDIVIEVVGHQVGTIADAIEAVRPRGTIFYFGVPDDHVYPVPFYALFRKTLSLLTGAVPERAESLHLAVDYARQHPEILEALVSDVFSVHDAAAAFARADRVDPERLKVVLTYGEPVPSPTPEG